MRRSTAVVTDVDVLMSGLLHDVLEDTCKTAAELEAVVGPRTLSIVKECSDDKSQDKVTRKKLQIDHAATASVEARQVKLKAESACPPLYRKLVQHLDARGIHFTTQEALDIELAKCYAILDNPAVLTLRRCISSSPPAHSAHAHCSTFSNLCHAFWRCHACLMSSQMIINFTAPSRCMGKYFFSFTSQSSPLTLPNGLTCATEA